MAGSTRFYICYSLLNMGNAASISHKETVLLKVLNAGDNTVSRVMILSHILVHYIY